MSRLFNAPNVIENAARAVALLCASGALLFGFCFGMSSIFPSTALEWVCFLSLRAFILLAGIAVVTGLISGLAKSMRGAQIQLFELVLTLLLAGGLMSGAHIWIQSQAQTSDGMGTATLIALTLISLGSGLGALWGWRAAFHLDCSQQLGRITLLGCGWLLMAGAVGLGMGGFGTLQRIVGNTLDSKDWIQWGYLGFAALPGLLLEIRIWWRSLHI